MTTLSSCRPNHLACASSAQLLTSAPTRSAGILGMTMRDDEWSLDMIAAFPTRHCFAV